jgi:3-hydroxybutyryl-CoA dehydrogenase
VTGLPSVLGVLGAGTMGAGIAELGCVAGFTTHLYDPFPEELERAGERIRRRLARAAERGRIDAGEAAAAGDRLVLSESVDDLHRCELTIEAAPERLELKRDLLRHVSEVAPQAAIHATNTSSILVTSLASAALLPEHVVGMHFFNPPPAMRLLEVVRAEQTGERALEVARAVGERMGKHVIVVDDGPGFLVNRCGRPFGAEGLRLLQERVATVEQIDRVCRLGGGFRMGPFELMDLVGIDVGLEVARSFDEQSFGEPRWKPNPLQARMVAAGRLGRKAGRGWYAYEDERPHRPEDPEPPAPGGGDGRRVAIDGSGALARELRDRAGQAGFDARAPDQFGGAEEPQLVVDCSVPAPVSDLGLGADGVPTAVLCADRSLAERDMPRACGFHLLPPLESTRLVEHTRLASSDPRACEAAAAFFGACGFHVEWVGDGPGLVLGRIVCQLVNEAAFAIGEGVGAGDDVDAGLRLGLNHPRGPVEWGNRIGLRHVLATVDGLFAELHDPRYRAAPRLRRAVATGRGLD